MGRQQLLSLILQPSMLTVFQSSFIMFCYYESVCVCVCVCVCVRGMLPLHLSQLLVLSGNWYVLRARWAWLVTSHTYHLSDWLLNRQCRFSSTRCLSLWINVSYRNESVLIVRGDKECTKTHCVWCYKGWQIYKGLLFIPDIGSVDKSNPP